MDEDNGMVYIELAGGSEFYLTQVEAIELLVALRRELAGVKYPEGVVVGLHWEGRGD